MAAPSPSRGTSPEAIKGYFDEFLAVANDQNGWEDVAEKLEVKVTQKSGGESGISIVKGEGVIKATPEQVKDLLYSVENRGKWDTFFEKGRIHQEIEKGKVGIVWYQTKSSMTVWARDFVTLVAFREDNGGYIMIAKSIETDELPEISGNVRGKVWLSGFILKPVNEGKHTKITYIFQVDASGWVPVAVVNKVNTYQPLGIIGMRKVLTGSPQP